MTPTHIGIDFARAPEEARELWTGKCVKGFLKAAVELTGLHAITKPQVVEHLEDGVLHIDGHVIIAESHVHVLVLPELGRGWADVFSCKDVHPGHVAVAIDQAFGGWQTIRCIPRVELAV